MRIHYFQHVPYEGLACIEDWINQKSYPLSVTRFQEGEEPPAMSTYDWLFVMGGPMGVYEQEKYPWLKGEIDHIRQAIEAGKTVIGICLGSQLIASALGQAVFPNKEPEIGFFPVKFTAEAQKHSLFSIFPDEMPVFHFHGDTFDLPYEAKHLCFSEAAKNQGFLYKENVLGLQYHFELTEEAAIKMIENNMDQLKPAKYVQNELQIRAYLHLLPQINRYMYAVLNYFDGLNNF
jgi:GMP synthase (glutamine-hydrolysing)